MKTLVCTQPGQLHYSIAEQPQLRKGQAIIKIRRIGVCGTDLHAFEGTQPYFNYPRILGHELSGELAEADEASGFKTGDMVSVIPYLSCGVCIACRTGKTNCCTQMQVYGVHIDGGMAEYLSVPSTGLLSGEGLSADELALLEPLAIGAHGVRRAQIQPGEYVLVVGAGPIGMGTMEFARLAGANVIALDINEARLQFCREKLKVDHTIHAAAPDVFQQIREITRGDMPTVVFDVTGNVRAINNAFQYMAHGGRYVLIGLQKETISFSHPEFHKREGTLMSSRNATRQDFAYVLDSVKRGDISPINYITHRVSFPEAAGAFESWLNPASGVIKAIIEL
jgi:2-desacetyl-2-hydroxyethyl bacteriochlorophyllide A dehydrogenase